MRLLDLFCGRWGWSRAFAARGWECVGVDLVEPSEVPKGCEFMQMDVLDMNPHSVSMFDFGIASSPCEKFSVFGMRMFHANPPYPSSGIQLFNFTRGLFEQAGLPYVMENVRAAQEFVGNAVNHCGPFYLWGNAVPPLLPQGIMKGFKMGSGKRARELKAAGDREGLIAYRKEMDSWHNSKSPQRIANTAKVATIPPELANCVADYAERILERRTPATDCSRQDL